MSGAVLAAWVNTNPVPGVVLTQHDADWADLVVAGVGINIQPTFSNEYQQSNYPAVKSLLADLGVAAVRGQVPQDSNPALNFYQELYEDLGIECGWTAGVFVEGPLTGAAVNDPARTAIRAWFAGLNATQKQMVRWIGGYNEPNGARIYGHVVGTQAGEDWWYTLSRVHQRFLWGVINGGVSGVTQVPGMTHVLVTGPALHDHPPGRGLSSDERLRDDFLKIGPDGADHSAFMNRINLHGYPSGQIPSNRIDERNEQSQAGVGVMPVIVSETGYNNGMNTSFVNRTPASVIGKYMPRMVVEHLRRKAGTSTPMEMMWFELLNNAPPTSNDNQNFYGIVTVQQKLDPDTWAPMPAYRSLQRMLDRFRDPGTPVTPDPLGYEITPGSGTSSSEFTSLKSHLWGKRDGSYQLVLWRDLKIWNTQTQVETNPPGVNIDVEVETPRTIRVYRPSQQAAPINTVTATNLTVSVDEELLVLDVAA